MRELLGKCREVLGIGLTWGMIWAAVFAAAASVAAAKRTDLGASREASKLPS